MTRDIESEKMEAIFTLVSSVKENIRAGALNAAMANLVKALQLYLTANCLKREREVLEQDYSDLLVKISKHPKFAQTYGRVDFRTGHHKENIDFMTQLIQFGADNIKDQIAQGIELLAAERRDEARAIFEEILSNPDAEVEHFLMIGDEYLKKSMWPEAQKVFYLAMKKWPESLHVLNRMAISLRKGKKFEQALAVYRKTLMLSPDDEGIFYNLARLFLDMGNPKNALQAIQKSLTLNPSFAPALKLAASLQQAADESAEK